MGEYFGLEFIFCIPDGKRIAWEYKGNLSGNINKFRKGWLGQTWVCVQILTFTYQNKLPSKYSGLKEEIFNSLRFSKEKLDQHLLYPQKKSWLLLLRLDVLLLIWKTQIFNCKIYHFYTQIFVDKELLTSIFCLIPSRSTF